MTVLLLSFGLMAFLMLAMAVGVLLGGKELKGSCGGVGGDCACDAAGIPRKCERTDEPDPTDEIVGLGNPSRA